MMVMGRETILVVDDDREIAGAIEIYLRAEGYGVRKAYDGLAALAAISGRSNGSDDNDNTGSRSSSRNSNSSNGRGDDDDKISLIIMDVMMPRMDGVRATMKIREDNNIPIIMLSAKSEDYDKVTGLNIGADDYVTKPFNPLELIARVKSLLRRYTELGSAVKGPDVIKTGGLIVDKGAREVSLDGELISLTPTEYGILVFLTENAGHVYSIEQIYEAVWQEPSYNPENTVAVHIRRIREKIEIDPGSPRYLKVVWGIGYKIEKI
jgi:DNA-binding response OmpR family regulator